MHSWNSHIWRTIRTTLSNILKVFANIWEWMNAANIKKFPWLKSISFVFFSILQIILKTLTSHFKIYWNSLIQPCRICRMFVACVLYSSSYNIYGEFAWEVISISTISKYYISVINICKFIQRCRKIEKYNEFLSHCWTGVQLTIWFENRRKWKRNE